MSTVNDIFLLINSYIGGAFWFPILLLGTGIFFTVYLKFPQFRFFKDSWKKLFFKRDSDASGETSHFQALATALSGTVGTGNIGGVAFAIFLGGPAALFWMWVTAFLGMTSKMVEVTLSHKYREMTEDGTVAGGPMYYMDKGLNWKPMAILFAIATVASSFGSGSLPQIANISQTMHATFDIEPVLTGAVMAVILGLVIIGGIRRIVKVTSSVLPVMGTLYLIGALAVIFGNFENIVPSFTVIFEGVFSGSAAAGGFLGASIAFAFTRGVDRGLYSNEAGQGSAPIAHASAQTKESVAEGTVALLEPFIDTLIICTITGLVILSSGVWTQKFDNQFHEAETYVISGVYSEENSQHRQQLSQFLDTLTISNTEDVKLYNGSIQVVNGVPVLTDTTILHARSIAEKIRMSDSNGAYTGKLMVKNGQISFSNLKIEGYSLIHSAKLTSEAFTKSYFGESGRYIVAIVLLLFAFSTAVTWSYYGDRAITYLVGVKGVMPYRIVYVFGFFIASFTDTVVLWNFAGITIALMTVPNIIGLLMMRKEVKQLVENYDS